MSSADFLQLSVDQQDWILLIVTIFCLILWFTPCIISGRRFQKIPLFSYILKLVHTRLNVYFLSMIFITFSIIVTTVNLLPDWNLNQYVVVLVSIVVWFLENVQKFFTSFFLACSLYFAWVFKGKISVILGIDHVQLVKFNIRDYVPFGLLGLVNLQSYWTIEMIRKPTVVLDYGDYTETYSRIGLWR
jgi:hypothetical protein